MSIVFGFLSIQAQQITPDSPAEGADRANSTSCEFNAQNYNVTPSSESSWWDIPLLRILVSFFTSKLSNNTSSPYTNDILHPYSISTSHHEDFLSSFIVVEDENQQIYLGPSAVKDDFGNNYDGNKKETRFKSEVNVWHISNREASEEAEANETYGVMDLNSKDQPVSNLNDKKYSSRFAKSQEAKTKSTNKKDVTLNPVHRGRYTEEQMGVIRQGWNQYARSDAEEMITLLSPKHVSSLIPPSDDMQQEEDMDIRPEISSQSNDNAKYMSNKRLDAIMSTVFDMGFNPEYDKESGIVTVGVKLTFEQRAPTPQGIVMWELVKGTK